MSVAISELNARLAELKAQAAFVSIAGRLRPRLNGVLNWQAQGEELELAKQYIGQKQVNVDSLYGPLLIKALGAFERFVRMCIAEALLQKAAAASHFGDLQEGIRRRHFVLSGRLLSSLEEPLDHLSVSAEQLIEHLWTCRDGNRPFHLNTIAFEAVVTGAAPAVVERAFKNIGREDWWDRVGDSKPLENLLGCEGAGPRNTGNKSREHLRALWKWRNALAHGGDAEPALTEHDLLKHLEFLHLISGTLHAISQA